MSALCTSVSWLCTVEVDGLLQVFILVDRRDLVFTGNAGRQLVELSLLVCLCQKSFVRVCGFRFSSQEAVLIRPGQDSVARCCSQGLQLAAVSAGSRVCLSWQVCARSHSSLTVICMFHPRSSA
jgi:hypothetical protein